MGVGLIDPVRAAVLTDHCPKHARAEHPRVQFPPALAERIFKTLLRPCSETVERDRKACNTHFRHDSPPLNCPTDPYGSVFLWKTCPAATHFPSALPSNIPAVDFIGEFRPSE